MVRRDRRGRWGYRFRWRGKRYGGWAPRGAANTETIALALEREHLDRLARRRHSRGSPTVRQFVATFLDYQRTVLKPLTYERQSAVLRLHVVPEVGDERLRDVGTRALAELTVAWAGRGARPRTINTWLGDLARLLSLAAEWEVIPRAPRPKFLRVPHDVPRFLSDEEARRLCEAADPRWRSMVLVALRTGMRVGELRGLNWEDVDFGRGAVVVRRSDPGRRDMPVTSPKGGRHRTVALSPDCAGALLELRRGTDRPPGARVWPARDGVAARSMRSCWGAIRRAAERAGLEDVAWHTLRHTCASWLVMRGVSIRVVQAVLGHASVTQTERYAHLAPDFAFAAAMRLLDYPLAPPSRRVARLAGGRRDSAGGAQDTGRIRRAPSRRAPRP